MITEDARSNRYLSDRLWLLPGPAVLSHSLTLLSAVCRPLRTEGELHLQTQTKLTTQ